jgi:hypothetical protein
MTLTELPKKTWVKTVPLTYSFRLPNQFQPRALNFLAATKNDINSLINSLWPNLASFAKSDTNARSQIESAFPKPEHLESRQYRGIAETAGRILRAQADRFKIFTLIQPILGEKLIKQSLKYKDRKAIQDAVLSLKAALAQNGANAIYMQNVVEQACNVFLKTGKFPETFFDLQPVPTLKLGLFTYAADDGGEQGKMYHYRIADGVLHLKLKVLGEKSKLTWTEELVIALPGSLQDAIKNPERLCAPTLREVEEADGGRYAVLDIILERRELDEPAWENRQNVLAFDWGVRNLLTIVALTGSGEQLSRPYYLDTGGFDGRQARLRRQIDELKSKVEKLAKAERNVQRDGKRAVLEDEIKKCWAAYERRNASLAHLCSNMLLLLAEAYGCHAIAGEWLGTLKSVGRGRNTRSRWRNWRNNTTIRSAITDKMKYKCRLRGVKLRLEYPRGTSHTCPRCGMKADTYKSPEHDVVIDSGAWLKCGGCGWNGSRDYAGALNIGRLAVAFYQKISAARAAGEVNKKTNAGYRIAEINHKPASYIGVGAALPIPPRGNQQKAIFFCSHEDVSLKKPVYSFSGWDRMISVYPKFQNGPVGIHRLRHSKGSAGLHNK